MSIKTTKAFTGCYFFTHNGVSIDVVDEKLNGGSGWSVRSADIEERKLVGYGDADEVLPTKRDAIAAAISGIDYGYIQ